MECLICKPGSEAFYRLQLSCFTKEEFHVINGGKVLYRDGNNQEFSMFGREDLMCAKQNPDAFEYVGDSTRIESLDVRNAKKLVEIQKGMNLVPLCAKRELLVNRTKISLVAAFDGLEDGVEGRAVWVHVPWNADNAKMIRDLGWDRLLDDQFRYEVEFLLIVASSIDAIITCSDGTFANTVTATYTSTPVLRSKVLVELALFQAELNRRRVEHGSNSHES